MKEEEEDSYGVREPAVKYQYLSQEEYLDWERSSVHKHEYYKGEVFAMSGALMPHNYIFSNVFMSLAIELKGKDCIPFGPDFRVHIPKNTLYTYPDISIVCDELKTKDDEEKDNLLNPSVIIEILSKSTRKYDLGFKFDLYKDIESLQEYILIDSEAVFVQQHIRDENNNWQMIDYRSAKDSFTIRKVNAALPISEVYFRTGLL